MNFLNTLKQKLTAAGRRLKAAWQQLRRTATALWQLFIEKVGPLLLAARQKAAAHKAAATAAAKAFWQEHKSQLAWSAVVTAITFVATVALVALGMRYIPTVESWLTDLASGTLRLPAGYALRLIRMARTVATPASAPSPNGPQPQPAAV